MNVLTFDAWQGWQNPDFRPSHLYQTREWFEVLTKTWTNLKIKMATINDTVVLPFFTQQRGPLRLVGSPLRGFFTPYGGPMGLENPDNLRDYLYADFCELALPPGFITKGIWQDRKTILLDLNLGIDKIWSDMERATRRQIQQGETRGAIIREESGSDWIQPFYKLICSTYSRRNLPPPAPLAFYENIARNLIPKHAKVLMAYSDGAAIAGAIFGLHKDTIYGIDRGADRDYQQLRANNLIDWTIIQWAISVGLKTYDMVGGNIPGIAQYKLGFGAREVNYPTLTWTPTPLGKLAWGGYSKLKGPMQKFSAWRASR